MQPGGANISDALLTELRRIVAGDELRVSVRTSDRMAYGRDLWPRLLLGLERGVAAPFPPDAIVWPQTVEEIVALVRFAAKHRIPIVPFGGGSGVCGSALALEGGLVIDLKRMNRLLELDIERMEATFEAGILGEHLEHRLNQDGLTLGHFPSSIMISTLGGWLATRSAGQASTKYGKIEDMTLGFGFVTGQAERLQVEAIPGCDLRGLFIGSEGTLGLFTDARLRVSPLPPARYYAGWLFPRLEAGLDAIRRICQQAEPSSIPTVLRLYDETETLLHGLGSSKATPSKPHRNLEKRSGPTDQAKRSLLHFGLEQSRIFNRITSSPAASWLARNVLGALGGCRLIVGFEGTESETQAAVAAARPIFAQAGGQDLGEAPGRHWLANRYAVSFEQSRIFFQGAFVDTMEVATTWDRLESVYAAVRQAASQHVLVMAHFSHVYAEGCSIYFTFVGTGMEGGEEANQATRKYDRLWRNVLRATLRAGGVVSHHHGIGVLKQEFLVEELGEGMELLRAAKQVLDPHGICNPGKLGLT